MEDNRLDILAEQLNESRIYPAETVELILEYANKDQIAYFRRVINLIPQIVTELPAENLNELVKNMAQIDSISARKFMDNLFRSGAGQKLDDSCLVQDCVDSLIQYCSSPDASSNRTSIAALRGIFENGVGEIVKPNVELRGEQGTMRALNGMYYGEPMRLVAMMAYHSVFARDDSAEHIKERLDSNGAHQGNYTLDRIREDLQRLLAIEVDPSFSYRSMN